MTPATSQTYLVFARKKAEEALTEVGRIVAPDRQAIMQIACRDFGDSWLEMIAIPQSSAAWAIEEE
ncbi:MAG TPA: hypothetical protein VFR10_04415 [bacterium]|nr:hypothetical protein [bacterium]